MAELTLKHCNAKLWTTGRRADRDMIFLEVPNKYGVIATVHTHAHEFEDPTFTHTIHKAAIILDSPQAIDGLIEFLKEAKEEFEELREKACASRRLG